MNLIEKQQKAYELWEYAYQRVVTMNKNEIPSYYVLFDKMHEWKQKKEFAHKVEQRLFNYYLKINQQYINYLNDIRRWTIEN